MSARIRVTPVPRFIPVTAVPRVAVATLHVGTLSGPARLIGQPAESDGVRSAGFRREVRAVRRRLVGSAWIGRRPGTDVVV